MFIDAHSHMDLLKNYRQAIQNAKEKNIKILTAGIDIKSNRKILELKKQNPEIEICLGIYPTETLKLSEKEIDSEIDFIKRIKTKLLQSEKLV